MGQVETGIHYIYTEYITEYITERGKTHTHLKKY